MRYKVSNLFFGLTFIAAAVIVAVKAFGYNVPIFFEGWWTLFIIVPSLASLIRNGFNAGNIIFLAIGVILLLDQQNIGDGNLLGKLIFPIVLFAVGLQIIFRNYFIGKAIKKIENVNKDGLPNYTAVFGGQEQVFANEEFAGANILAVFGGVNLNLKNAIINNDILINANCIFGGGELLVPNNVRVKISSVPVFGGVSNKVPAPVGDNVPTVYINAVCVFGGLEIK